MVCMSGVPFGWSADGLGEGGGVDAAASAELQEEAVLPAGMELGVERDRAAGAVGAGGVHVRVGEVRRVQGDEVAVGAQVRLQVADRAATERDAERELGLLAGGQLGRA